MLLARPALAAALVVDGALVLGQAAAPDGGTGAGELVGFVNYGVLGALFVLWLTRRIRTAGEVDEANARTAAAVARAEAAEARERALYESLRADVVPAMTRIADRLSTVPPGSA